MRILSSCVMAALFSLACSSGEGDTSSDPLPQAGSSSGGAGSGGAAGESGSSGQSGASGQSSPGGSGGQGGAGQGGVGQAGAGGSEQAGGACTLSKPYSSKDQDCNACAQELCCAQVNACLDDARCDDDYVNCALACALLPDGSTEEEIKACLADCATQHPEGKQLYDAAIGCVDQVCAAPCQ